MSNDLEQIKESVWYSQANIYWLQCCPTETDMKEKEKLSYWKKLKKMYSKKSFWEYISI